MHIANPAIVQVASTSIPPLPPSSPASTAPPERADEVMLEGPHSRLDEFFTLFRVMADFLRGFRVLHFVGPCVTVFGSARIKADSPHYDLARKMGAGIARLGFTVLTGGGPGIMEAGHLGAGREKSIGLNILLPFEQSANPVILGDAKLMHLKYFFTRKLMFVKESDAVVLFPGGFGTLDEGFEVLTLVQTGKSHLFPIVMVDAPGSDYWQHFLRFCRDVLVARKLISPWDLNLFKVTTSVDEAVQEVLTFYRVYHSMRYVRGDLVVRLNQKVAPETLEFINTNFTDILHGGGFEQTTALPEEHGDPHLAHLPRLKFRFDRHKLGRLRQLIDTINHADLEEPGAK